MVQLGMRFPCFWQCSPNMVQHHEYGSLRTEVKPTRFKAYHIVLNCTRMRNEKRSIKIFGLFLRLFNAHTWKMQFCWKMEDLKGKTFIKCQKYCEKIWALHTLPLIDYNVPGNWWLTYLHSTYIFFNLYRNMPLKSGINPIKVLQHYRQVFVKLISVSCPNHACVYRLSASLSVIRKHLTSFYKTHLRNCCHFSPS